VVWATGLQQVPRNETHYFSVPEVMCLEAAVKYTATPEKLTIAEEIRNSYCVCVTLLLFVCLFVCLFTSLFATSLVPQLQTDTDCSGTNL
jgi:hypothetical protein